MKLTDKEISGTTVEVHVDRYGTFDVRLPDQGATPLGRGDTLEAAVASARPQIAKRKMRVNVPFFTRAGERGYAYGLHAGSGNPMAEIEGTKQQLDYNSRQAFSAEMPREELERYLRVVGDIRALRREQNAIEQEFGVNVESLVQAAVAEAQARAS